MSFLATGATRKYHCNSVVFYFAFLVAKKLDKLVVRNLEKSLQRKV